MNTFVIEDFFVSDENACNFYMVRFDEQDTSEVDKFYDNYHTPESPHYEDMQNIHALIEIISEDGTEMIRRSRDEGRAFALPPEVLANAAGIQVTGNALRLYYLHVTSEIIVLLGGGIAHNEPDGHPPIQLRDAQLFIKKIWSALGTEFEISNKRLIPLDGLEIIIH